MKYQVIQIDETHFAVHAGRKDKYFTNSVTTDRTEAEADAARRSAMWHIAQAEELLKKTTMQGAYEIGGAAHWIVEDVTSRAEREDPDFDPHDPKAWTC